MIIMVNEPFYGQTIYTFIFIKNYIYLCLDAYL